MTTHTPIDHITDLLDARQPAKPRRRPNHKTIAMAYAQAEEWQKRYEHERDRTVLDIVIERTFRACKRW